jgi:hypothetical protein
VTSLHPALPNINYYADDQRALIATQPKTLTQRAGKFVTALNQLFVEIKQDTKDVLGLHAAYNNCPQLKTLRLLY